jgi:hypothetical protein
MLEFLKGKAGERKLRLFAVACCRRISETTTYARAHKAVDAAERYADGLATGQELREAGEAAWKGARWTRDGTRSAAVATSEACSSPTKTYLFLTCANVVCNHVAPGFDGVSRTALRTERSAIAALLRDLFGPLPFREVRFNPGWLTWNDSTVRKLAQAIYDERILPEGLLDQSRLAILADALEEAGCDNEEILSHLRQRGQVHVRGCWAIDLLSGKE